MSDSLSLKPPTVRPARLRWPQPGVAWSEDYGDIFHSRDGAWAQAREVFLRGCDLPARWGEPAHRPPGAPVPLPHGPRQLFVVLETGFGLGVNFLSTWQAWRQARRPGQRLRYVALDLHPVTAQALRQAVPTDDAERAELAERLASRWPAPVAGLYTLHLEQDPQGCGGVELSLFWGEAAEVLAQWDLQADAIYLDGFSPARNPAMWSREVLTAVTRRARPGARLATWCVTGTVRRELQALGWSVQRLPGFGAKRQRLQAVWPGAALPQPSQAAEVELHAVSGGPPQPVDRARAMQATEPGAGSARGGSAPAATTVAVVGAGLAGCALAHALARRGVQVLVLEQGDTPAAGASGLPWGLMHPQLSADDNRAARLTRLGFAWMLDQFAHWQAQGVDLSAVWRPLGVWRQPGRSGRTAAALQQAWAQAPQWLSVEPAPMAMTRCGVPASQPGLWWPRAGAVAPAALCRLWLQQAARLSPGTAIWRGGMSVQAVRRQGMDWLLLGQDGQLLARADQVVLANAGQASALAGLDWPQTLWRGQVAFGRTDQAVTAGRAGDVYLVPASDGRVCVGSTYERPGQWLTREQALAQLQAQWEGLWPAGQAPAWACDEQDPQAVFEGQRCALRDRLPAAGAAGSDGLWVLAGLGSRGLCLAGLLAEQVAARMLGPEPAWLPADLLHAVDPLRFAAQGRQRGGQTPRIESRS